jgi:hypothetical protein
MKAKPGDTFLGVRCHNGRCGQFIAMFEIASGKEAPKMVGPGKLRTTCPACHEPSDYGTQEVFSEVVPQAPRSHGRPPVS